MTTIVALYGAQGGETVFDTRTSTLPRRRITVADGTDILTGRIGGLSGYLDAYICWDGDNPVRRIPAWSVSVHYENDDAEKAGGCAGAYCQDSQCPECLP